MKLDHWYIEIPNIEPKILNEFMPGDKMCIITSLFLTIVFIHIIIEAETFCVTNTCT